MDAIIKRSSSYGGVRERLARSPSVSQMLQSTRLQNPAEWRSVTHPVKSASLPLPPSSSSFTTSPHLHVFPFFLSSSFPLTLAHLFLGSSGLRLPLQPRLNFIPSSFSMFFFFVLFFSPGHQHPRVSISPLLQHMQPSVFLPFGTLGRCYIKSPLSQVRVELTHKYNVTTLERSTNGELWHQCETALTWGDRFPQ